MNKNNLSKITLIFSILSLVTLIWLLYCTAYHEVRINQTIDAVNELSKNKADRVCNDIEIDVTDLCFNKTISRLEINIEPDYSRCSKTMINNSKCYIKNSDIVCIFTEKNCIIK